MLEETKLNKNDEIEVEIERFGANGEGIAIFNGAVIFVPYAIPGERCLVHIVSDKKSFYFAKLVKVLRPSADRCQPPCPYFYKCGGCDIEHINYEKQLELKREIVRSDLKKYGDMEPQVCAVEPSELEFRYRNKFAFPIALSSSGEVQVGLYRKHSHDVLNIEDCLIQSAKTANILKIVKKYIQIPAIYEKFCENPNLFKHIVVREHGNKCIVTMVVGDAKFDNFLPLVELLKTQPFEFGLYQNINLKNNNIIFGEQDKHIYGLRELEIEEIGIKYFVNNRSFLQVNDGVKQKVYGEILNALKGETCVVDAYSGAGLLSGIIAKNVSLCYGIEIVREASQNADEIKKTNNLVNLVNICGDCSEELPKVVSRIGGRFSIVVDPPRKGVDEGMIDTILKSKPNKIVYLSCNPATLARDLKLLCGVYEVKFVKPYDMFPQTANVETLVLLELKVSAAKKKPKKRNNTGKDKYFAFYDDIKDKTHKVVDW